MRSSKFLSFVLGVLSACGLALSAEATQYVIGSDGTIDLSDCNYVTLENCQSENNGANIGSTGSKTVMTAHIANNTEGDYILTWKGGSKNAATNKVAITTSAGYSVSGVFPQPNTGDWSLTTEYSLVLLGGSDLRRGWRLFAFRHNNDKYR